MKGHGICVAAALIGDPTTAETHFVNIERSCEQHTICLIDANIDNTWFAQKGRSAARPWGGSINNSPERIEEQEPNNYQMAAAIRLLMLAQVYGVRGIQRLPTLPKGERWLPRIEWLADQPGCR